jgi:hypothetical protein
MDGCISIDARGDVFDGDRAISRVRAAVIRQTPRRFPLASAFAMLSSAERPPRALKIIEKSEQN